MTYLGGTGVLNDFFQPLDVGDQRSGTSDISARADLKIDSLESSHLSVTRLRFNGPNFGFMPTPQREDAYFVGVKLQAVESARMWYGERLPTSAPMLVNSLCLTHFDNQPHAELYDPFDCMVFKVPTTALFHVLDDAGAARIESLCCPQPGAVDLTIGRLAACLVPMLNQPSNACTLFVDSVTHALNAYLLRVYGGVRFRTLSDNRGGLAVWQENRLKDLIASNLEGNLTLSKLAKECDMSIGHFGQAFKKSAGLTPYQYLISQRLNLAKELLANTSIALQEVARASGFSSQQHFNRRFVKANGLPPGVWRRLYGKGSGKIV
jgi:AraC family transcriptional regulator